MTTISASPQFFQPPQRRRRSAIGGVLRGLIWTRAASAAAARSRVTVVMLGFMLLFCVFVGRLVYFGALPEHGSAAWRSAQDSIAAARPDILDRNGDILATDIRSVSLFAEPRKVLDADEATELLASVLPELGDSATRAKLASNAGFVWLKRELSPAKQQQIHDLGIPGIGFLQENKRFYPGGNVAAHVLGGVNVDNQGIAGLEKTIDGQGLADLHALGFAQNEGLAPVKLALDLKIQHAVRDELIQGIQRYHAQAAVGIVLNVRTGEVVAMSSVPDFDSNDPTEGLEKDKINRATAGVFELGSVFKMFTIAAALDTGATTLSSVYDASVPLRIGRFTIHDFHGKHRPLTVPEVFIYSSNIGTGRMTLAMGGWRQFEYFKRFGFTHKLQTDLPEVGAPIVPRQWKDITAVTASFGHGISVSPMQAAAAAVALVNGGIYIPPTFFPRTAEEAAKIGTRVVSARTSAEMRYLFRLNVEKGSGRKANVPGYDVGGKTGTAEKVIHGRYSKDQNLNSFLAAVPMDNPQYVILTVLDDPRPETPGAGRSSGANVVPLAGNILRRILPMLGIQPKPDTPAESLLAAN
ncbi:peptidoglycan D,D-transpeptidase FtsI family protein [Segnochrobactrum spirostomi]|uniref:Penicillin-binding protein 2 n=1 Tax=Segnochrobactrum spirostomi TaxID=2608987 RepID=A0A6A7Y4X9_9HYPH|nr:penicillin-binding protein 2 [Segnochrobactrum spirostomi]MQT13785.1 penicillin-binding protein 2 [Segnochrobactrum spirostomi]